MAIIFAGDLGHTYYKGMATIQGKTQKVFFESVLGEVQPLLGEQNGYLQLETKEGAWFVGQAALEQSKNQIWGQASAWAFQPEYKALHLLAISEIISPQTYEIDVYLVSGLPRSDWSNRQAIARSLTGQHTISRLNRDRKLTINILDVSFTMQGIAALQAGGRIRDDMTVAYLGLGGRNKTFATQRGNHLVADKCGSDEGGLLTVIDDFIKRVQRQTGRELKIHEAIEAMAAGQIRSRGKLYEIDVNKILEPYVQSIHSLIGQVWGNTTGIDQLRIGGGGALVAGETIAGQYEQAVIVEDPQWQEVRGQLMIGQNKKEWKAGR